MTREKGVALRFHRSFRRWQGRSSSLHGDIDPVRSRPPGSNGGRFADGRPVLITTGSRNLAPYAEAAHRTGIPLTVRVLDAPESLAACRAAGIGDDQVIADRGPFTLEENLAAIRRFGIGVLVAKESGQAGGLDAKLSAARETNCQVIVLSRPKSPNSNLAFESPAALIAALQDLVPF